MADCIDRQTAINAICQEWCNRDYCGECFYHGARQAIDVLKALPSADITNELNNVYEYGYTAAEDVFRSFDRETVL